MRTTLKSQGQRTEEDFLPGGGAEGQSSDGVVVSQEASVRQQGERLVRLPHSQKRRLGGQVPQSDRT